MNKFTYNNRSEAIIKRARTLFKKIESDLSNQEKLDVKKRLTKILESFNSLYSNLGKPNSIISPFEGRLAPKSAKLNKSMAEIREDLDIAYREVETLNQSMAEVFNYAQTLSNDLVKASEVATSKVVDLRLLGGQLNQSVLIAGDDFKSTEKIDESFGLQNPRADVFLDQGAVTLKRTSSNSIVNENTDIKVSPVAPNNIKTNPTVDNIDRFYEGNFYNFPGLARPEGGVFHLEQFPLVRLQNTGQQSFSVIVNRPDPSGLQSTVDQRLAQDDPNTNPSARLRPEDILIFDRGASEEEKKNIRKYLVDGNASTFWECEYVKTDNSLQNIVEDSNLDGGGRLPTVNPDGTITEESSGIVTLDDLRQLSRNNSSGEEDDFVVDVTLTFEKEEIINWISLIPNNFDESAWIRVVDISYSNSEQTTYARIPSFNDSVQDNILTDEANAELRERDAEAILAPSKFSYRGIGVWNFDPVYAKSVRIRLKQKSSVPAPYQRLAIRLHRVFTQVYTDSTSSGGGLL